MYMLHAESECAKSIKVIVEGVSPPHSADGLHGTFCYRKTHTVPRRPTRPPSGGLRRAKSTLEKRKEPHCGNHLFGEIV
jgi:hypothetical protein